MNFRWLNDSVHPMSGSPYACRSLSLPRIAIFPCEPPSSPRPVSVLVICVSWGSGPRTEWQTPRKPGTSRVADPRFRTGSFALINVVWTEQLLQFSFFLWIQMYHRAYLEKNHIQFSCGSGTPMRPFAGHSLGRRVDFAWWEQTWSLLCAPLLLSMAAHVRSSPLEESIGSSSCCLGFSGPSIPLLGRWIQMMSIEYLEPFWEREN